MKFKLPVERSPFIPTTTMTDDIDQLKAENERLRAELENTQKELKAAYQTIRRARDANPVERPSAKRVLNLIANCCMSLEKTAKGWLLKMGHLTRKFKRLREIWELLITEDWILSEIFTEPPKTRRGSGRIISVAPKLPQRFGSLAPASVPTVEPEPLLVPF